MTGNSIYYRVVTIHVHNPHTQRRLVTQLAYLAQLTFPISLWRKDKVCQASEELLIWGMVPTCVHARTTVVYQIGGCVHESIM